MTLSATRAPDRRAPRPVPPRARRRYPGLDGLRGLAVAAVIAYHLNASWMPGGFLGVDVFFVLSGFLITSLLIDEWERGGTILLRAFWCRRARRLLPALLTLLGAVTVLGAVFAPDALPRLRGDLPASLGFAMNWRLALQHESYVSASARPPLLLHLWSLAVEEQFYLLWPPVLLVLLRRGATRAGLAILTAAGAATSTIVMGLAYRAHHDPSFAYFATDSHSQGLLVGCTLGLLVRPGRMRVAVADRARRVLVAVGAGGLGVTGATMAVLAFRSALTYRGGILVADLAAGAVIVIAVHPACAFGAALDCGPLRWAGTRSYALYLWHWPILDLTRPGADLPGGGWPVLVLRLAATVAAAEGSYRFVEQPWRRGRTLGAPRARPGRGPSRRRLTAPVSGTVALGATATVAALLATVSGPSAPPVLRQGATRAARAQPGQDPPAALSSRHLSPPPGCSGGGAQAAGTASLDAHEPILAIGDSVLLAASPALTATFGDRITVDAAVGRQPQAGLDRLATYRASGQLGRYRTVVVDLGTNGLLSGQDLRTLDRLTASVPTVVLYTVHAARSWVAASNDAIRADVASHPGNMRLADWNARASPSLLYPDGIHPDPAGARAYTVLLQRLLARGPG